MDERYMANRPRGLRHSHSLPMSMGRHSLRPNDQIFRAKPHAARSTMKAVSHITVRAMNPVLMPPSIRSMRFGRGSKSESVTFSPSKTEEPVVTNSFPAPMPRPENSALSAASLFGASLRPSPSVKKLLLAAIPGFFGLMGLGQLYEKRRSRGMFFLVAGALISFFSSWYTILPERLASFLTGSAALPPYALSWMSYFTGYSAVAGEASIVLLAMVPAMWAFQVYDSISPIAVASPPHRKSAIRMIPTTVVRASPKSRQEIDREVRDFAKNLGSAKSLISYLWER